MTKHAHKPPLRIFYIIYRSMIRSMQQSEDKMPLIGIIGVLGFFGYYGMWTIIYPQPYENFLLRMIGVIICAGLIAKNYWPRLIKPFFPIWWYFGALYTMSFFPTFIVLQNRFTTVSLIISMMSLFMLFLLVLLVDWLSLNILFFGGVTLAWMAYDYTTAQPVPPEAYLPYVSIYLFTVIAGSVLGYKSSLLRQKKLEGMAAISGSVAHELRTPLLGIKSGAMALQKYLPALFDTYFMAKQAGLEIPKIREAHFKSLVPIVKRIETETNYANIIIDMLLMSVGKIDAHVNVNVVTSIATCVREALERYPFLSEYEREKVTVDLSNEFEFIGSKILTVHIIFNLIKNALHFTAKAGKGDIFIWLEKSETSNTLHFKDTGPGIPSDVLPHLFQRFFTTTLTGNGIGLSFCRMVMESLGGQIYCRSEFHEYTEFILVFPAIETARALELERVAEQS